MIDVLMFKDWLSENTNYSEAVISDMASRMKRADKIVTWEPTTIYLYKLEQSDLFKKLGVSVKSQMRKAVKSYIEFTKDMNMKK